MERIVLLKDQKFDDIYKGQDNTGKISLDLHWSKTHDSWWIEIRAKKQLVSKVSLLYINSLSVAEERINRDIEKACDLLRIKKTEVPVFLFDREMSEIMVKRHNEARPGKRIL